MNIALYGKILKKESIPYLQMLVDKLEDVGVHLLIYKPFYKVIEKNVSIKSQFSLFSGYKDLVNNVDYLFSIGGDGTLLETITLIRDSNTPVLGINLGRLGFLSSVSKDEISAAVEQVMQNKYSIEERTLLQLNYKENNFGDINYALNELSIHKSEAYSMLTIKVNVDGKYLNTYWADGLIIATPTGSTAYSLSNGGPILTPDSKNFIITPIATHNLTVRPIVIPDSSVVTILVQGRNNNFNLGLDSRYNFKDKPVELEVRKSSVNLKLIKLQNESFFTTIRKKLNWGLDNRN
ncbi:MAG: NAD kinase [Bacteroidota bacterium]|nr:NAD kinase [Bacteroidota bacterium]